MLTHKQTLTAAAPATVPAMTMPPSALTPYGISERSLAQTANPIRELLKLVEDPKVMSFAGGLPDPALFPRAEIAAALDRIVTARTPDTLQYGMTVGSTRLRERLAQMMQNRYGVICSAANIVLTTGSQQAIDLAVRVLHNPGDAIAVEEPTYLGALQVFRAGGAHFTGFGTPCARRVALGYLIPDFCNPTGQSLTEAARLDHLEAAERGRYMLLEDAAYIELTYDRPRAKSLLALDVERCGSIEDARTLFLGTFSKTLMPGLRVGWACGPADVISRMTQLKECADILSPQLLQEAACDMLDSSFDTHVARIRATYHARRDAMMAALEASMPQGVRWTQPGGGMFTWLELPDHVDADALLPHTIREVGVAYVPGRHFMALNPRGNFLRLSFSIHETDRLADGIARFGACLGRVVQE